MSLSRKSRVALLAMLAGCISLVVSVSPALANPPVFENQAVYEVGSGGGAPCGDTANELCPGDITEADFDGDGDIDLATANRFGGNSGSNDDVTVFLNDGDGTYDDGTPFATGVSTFAIESGDFNNDGDADIAVGDPDSSPNNVVVLLNETDGGDLAFGDPQSTPSGGDFVVDLAVADFDADGDDDIAASNFSSSNVQILVSNGDGTFAAGSTLTVGINNPFGVDAGDFDGNGDPDLAIANNSGNELAIYLGGATATFTQGDDVETTNSPRQVVVADFNDDGDDDLAATIGIDANSNPTNRVNVALGNGDGTFGATDDFDTGNNSRDLTAGDYDLDGTTDIATQSAGDDNVISVLTNDGEAQFNAPVEFTVGNQGAIGGITTGDFNDDDGSDIAVTNFNDDTISVLLNNTDPATADCTIVGTNGNNNLTGTNGDDVICGLGGNDVINGLGGNDTIRGGDGDDRLDGDSGNDQIDGGNGNDRADGSGGSDTIIGGIGEDRLFGQDGNDTINGGANDDRLFGGSGQDSLNGAGGNDIVSGDNENDTLQGGSGDDILKGGAGTDRVSGNTGDDTLLSGTGRNDQLFGGDGNDRLNVRDGTANDRADGGDGRDTCASDSGDTVVRCEVNNSRSAPMQK